MHKSTSQFPDHIWSFAQKYILEFKSTSIACSQRLAQTKEKWTAPPPGVFKINVDGATSKNERNSSVEVVIRDAAGTVHVACCNTFRDNAWWRKLKHWLWSVV